MKAKEPARRIFLTEYTDRGHTVDRIFMGDKNREVRRAAVCMVITPDILRAAAHTFTGTRRLGITVPLFANLSFCEYGLPLL